MVRRQSGVAVPVDDDIPTVVDLSCTTWILLDEIALCPIIDSAHSLLNFLHLRLVLTCQETFCTLSDTIQAHSSSYDALLRTPDCSQNSSKQQLPDELHVCLKRDGGYEFARARWRIEPSAIFDWLHYLLLELVVVLVPANHAEIDKLAYAPSFRIPRFAVQSRR